MRIISVLTCVIGLWAMAAQPQDRAAVEAGFADWLQGDIRPMALAAGVSAATFDAALGDVRLNWDLPGLRPPGWTPEAPNPQREFGAPARYFNGIADLAAQGRTAYAQQADALALIEDLYGVPSHILVAIWGRETAFGRVDIPLPAFEVLAAHAYIGRDPAYQTRELIAALQIAEAAPVPLTRMKASWGGALGQPQFVPSNYLDHGADGDGDGKIDIWGSGPDSLASIARFLSDKGWVPGRDWGYEVDLPATVSCALEGPDLARPLAGWERLGITRINGRPFPEAERGGAMSLLLPAGRQGPAFLVTANFYVLKRYNVSDLYALFVGNLGDRIAYGSGDFVQPWQDIGHLTRGEIAALQERLIAEGFDTGGADGLPGYRTRRAIGLWQEGQGKAATCFPAHGLADG